MSNPKLTPKKLEEIRTRVQAATPYESGQYDPAVQSHGASIYWNTEADQVFTENAPTDVLALLAELDRTRPTWVPVAAGQHNYGDLYHVAGLPNEGQPPRWVGRGRYDAHSELWLDNNTNRPFTFPVTHFLLELTPTQLIGQPDGDEYLPTVSSPESTPQ